MSGKRLPGRYAALRKSVIPALFLAISTMPNGPRNRDLKLTGIRGRVGKTAPVYPPRSETVPSKGARCVYRRIRGGREDVTSLA